MATANPVEKMEVTDSQDSDINILLLGETGVGKSTFINSFVNYLQHTTLNNAMNSELACLIPLQFTVPNEDFEDRLIQFGSDQNEDTEMGNSSTQGARAYLFPFEDYNVRLIDTPGIGDARGLNQDSVNFENILTYISQYKHLHGICFLLKPNVSVINAYFKFCLVHLISRLERSAVNNIIFIFTNSRNTFYRPGETLPLLKRILNEIKEAPPYVEVLCSKKNMFCIDNEAFKFLIAKKQGIKFNDAETKVFEKSWKTSYKTCKDILSYICGDKNNDALLPHDIQNTISVNEARRLINDLSKPLADLSEFILDNLTVLNKQVTTLKLENVSKEDLFSKLYIPTIEFRVTELDHPMTVCTSTKCSVIFKCGDLEKYHYKQVCHKPCRLDYIPKEIIGTPALLKCAVMEGGHCIKCACNYSAHMHLYYETEIVHNKHEDISIKGRITSKQEAIKAITELVKELSKTIVNFKQESVNICKCMAKFAYFLNENSISGNNDSYLDYLNYLIGREESLGKRSNKARIKQYNTLKYQYEREKWKLAAYKNNKNATVVTASDIPRLVQFLYNQPLTGSKISKLHSIQQQSVQDSFQLQEYKYPKLMKRFVSESSSSDEDAEIPRIKLIQTSIPIKQFVHKQSVLNDQPSTSFSGTINVAMNNLKPRNPEKVIRMRKNLKRSYPKEDASTFTITPIGELNVNNSNVEVTVNNKDENDSLLEDWLNIFDWDKDSPSAKKEKEGKFD